MKNNVYFIKHLRIPRDVWELVKQYGIHHKGDESDMEWTDEMGYFDAERYELRGWFYEPAAIKALLNAGYLVAYRDRKSILQSCLL